MKVLLATPLLLLAACQVNKEGNQVTVQYNEDVAANAAADVGNTAKAVGGEIANDFNREKAKVANEVGDVDVNVDINRDRDGDKDTNQNAAGNRQ
jgi:hypothetical protein